MMVVHRVDFHLFEKSILKQCKLINNLTSIMLDSDNLKSSEGGETDKLKIMRKTFKFIEYLTSDDQADQHESHVKDVLQTIYEQTGLINNLIFNLNQPRDDDPKVLGRQIVLIGTMCQHLPEFQQSPTMCDTGTFNLIYIMSKMNDPTPEHLEFKLKSTIAIRKATSCRVVALLDSFVKNQICE